MPESSWDKFSVPESIYKTPVYLGQPISEVDNYSEFSRSGAYECGFYQRAPLNNEFFTSFSLVCDASVGIVTRLSFYYNRNQYTERGKYIRVNAHIVKGCIREFGNDYKIVESENSKNAEESRRPVLYWKKGGVEINLYYVPDTYFQFFMEKYPGYIRTGLHIFYDMSENEVYSCRDWRESQKWTREVLGLG